MQWDGTAAVAGFSHAVAALAYLALAALLLSPARREGAHARGMAAAALATVLWAVGCIVAVCVPVAGGAAPTWLLPLTLHLPESLRNAGWLSLLLVVAGGQRRLIAAVMLLPLASPMVDAWAAGSVLLQSVLPLAQSVLGMLLIEHLYRNAPLSARWGIKFACLGMGALFAYDFYLYSDAMLLRRVDPDIWSARGVINALSVPLLAKAMLRGPVWAPGLQLSRQIMFHSAALLGAALYLLAMAVSAWYLRSVGGAWGGLMQLFCLCGAALLLAALMFSGAARARVRIFISKHFYQGRYDYRQEWQHFTHALADDAAGLSERAIQALAGLVESPAGMLWRGHDDDCYRPVARWNMPLPTAEEGADGGLCSFLAARNWVMDLNEVCAQPERYAHLHPPAWSQGLWLIVPLTLDGKLFGFIGLAPPRTAFELNWEVRDVLKIAASQAASYLAHRASADSLAVARQFASYNRMSTFVVHDLKNLVSQLSLLLVNAEKHKANPAFQADMLETLGYSLTKLKHMLLKLRRDDAADVAAPLELDQLLARAVQRHVLSEPRPSLELRAAGLTVLADGQRLERVIGHLIQNAIDATPRSGRIAVSLLERDGAAVVELSDTGHGMSEQFVREQLFQPFVSTKSAGMGIGVFESREYLREVGGQLDVISSPSRGTTFRVTLPLHKEPVYGEK